LDWLGVPVTELDVPAIEVEVPALDPLPEETELLTLGVPQLARLKVKIMPEKR
jgi:hypothetical protein